MKSIIFIISTILISANAQTRPVLNTTDCNGIAPILDRNGNVVKYACKIEVAYTYADGVANCAKRGMDLMQLEDQFVYKSFMDYIVKYYSNICGGDWMNACGLFINGQKNLTDGKWYATVNGQQKVIDTSFFNFIGKPGNDPGNCMSVRRQEVFGNTAWNCAQQYGPICEFNNTYKPACTTSNQGKRYYNLRQCYSITTIRDGCGNVVKGACELVTPTVLPYDDAIQECRNQGMDLLTLDTKETYDSFMQYMAGKFGKHQCGAVWSPPCGLWVGGKQSSTGVWQAVKDWTSVNMVTSNYKFFTSQNAGQCMALKNNNGFGFMAYNCSQGYGE